MPKDNVASVYHSSNDGQMVLNIENNDFNNNLELLGHNLINI